MNFYFFLEKALEINSLDFIETFNPRVFYSVFIHSSNRNKNYAYIVLKELLDEHNYRLIKNDTLLFKLNILLDKGKKRHGKKTLSGYLYNQMHELIKNNLHEEDVQNFS